MDTDALRKLDCVPNNYSEMFTAFINECHPQYMLSIFCVESKIKR